MTATLTAPAPAADALPLRLLLDDAKAHSEALAAAGDLADDAVGLVDAAAEAVLDACDRYQAAVESAESRVADRFARLRTWLASRASAVRQGVECREEDPADANLHAELMARRDAVVALNKEALNGSATFHLDAPAGGPAYHGFGCRGLDEPIVEEDDCHPTVIPSDNAAALRAAIGRWPGDETGEALAAALRDQPPGILEDGPASDVPPLEGPVGEVEREAAGLPGESDSLESVEPDPVIPGPSPEVTAALADLNKTLEKASKAPSPKKPAAKKRRR